MNNYLKLFLLIVLATSKIFAQNQPKNILDSLLIYYSMEELKSMSLQERSNAKRLVRGDTAFVKILEKLNSEDKEDFYGIKVINEIPKGVYSEIDSMVNKIEVEKVNYSTNLFPNNYVDILDTFYGGFYKSFVNRTLNYPDYKEFFNQMADTGRFSNISRREYFFDRKNNLKLIIKEVDKNINDGSIYTGSRFTYKYKLEKYFAINDSLVFCEIINAYQPIYTEPSEINQEILDTTDVLVEYDRIYFYKNNAIKLIKQSGSFKNETWRELIYDVPKEVNNDPNNSPIIVFRNLKYELNDFLQGENDFIKNVKQSFIKPKIENIIDND